jgi:hypothetical protein
MLAAILCTRSSAPIPVIPVKHGGDDAGGWRKEKKHKKEVEKYNAGVKAAVRQAYAKVTGELPETVVEAVIEQVPVFVARETNDGYDLQAQLQNARVLIDSLIQRELIAKRMRDEDDDEEAILLLL